ncbi:hypothetical protein [Rhodoplanes sp. Z2-YC6860]|uniref:hypothetical protein n=1 Tax=Rhodoplanes sp. Z2-YC6860 TaxID=674703 RepID=UPI00078C43F4|nr:hypothetical protein [Rhodoplanes sp. Z2-YC6860]AMN43367.1 hypothetical protein RHPLAN_49430 [Rhodoplanes sp. Z2-YC6860]
MNDPEPEETKARRFAALPRWKRWLVYLGIINGRFLLMSDAERQTIKDEQTRRLLEDWPIWSRLLATAGLVVAAIAGPLQFYLSGQLTIGSSKLGWTRTIIPSEEPTLFVTTLLLLECTFVSMLYLTTKIFYFNGHQSR